MTVVVLDTNVWVAAAFRPASASARLVAAVRAGRLRLVWDDPTRAETEFVLRSIPRLSWDEVAPLFREIDRFVGRTDLDRFSGIPDPADRKFAALAAAARAVLGDERPAPAGRSGPGGR